MAKHIKLLLAAVVVSLAFGCSREKDLDSRLTDLEGRVAALEILCNQMNSNLSSIQTIVSAMEKGDYITNVSPLVENGKTVGYTITFAKGQPISIYNGQNGAAGHTPVIAVKQDTDGIWYWTIDGNWLLDANNQKVKAVGIDGKDGKDGKDGQNGQNGYNGEDGVTPQLKIEDGYWFVTTDGGSTWTKLGKATGDDGASGDSIFTSIDYTSSQDYVEFFVSGGQSFKVLKVGSLSIEFDSEDLVAIKANSSKNIHYTVSTGAEGVTSIARYGLSGSKMKEITLPTTLKIIGDCAFYGCGLESPRRF